MTKQEIQRRYWSSTKGKANRQRSNASPAGKAAMRRYRATAKGREAHRRGNLKSHLKKTFGLTLEEYDAILSAQGGGCAICKTATSGSRRWHIDHCHATGRVRGLLCMACNTGIGLLNDDPAVLAEAIRYLLAQDPHGPLDG
jgi:hypothetical protein